ncbi:MAG: 30S ribosomal protein S9 [Candidatus Aenigmarchaeota archaeon]|nr:30S ribosomal protein S9 [Candidatus Aenigmarchaeota archaeon]
MADKSKKITRSSVKQGAVVGKAKKTSVSKKIVKKDTIVQKTVSKQSKRSIKNKTQVVKNIKKTISESKIVAPIKRKESEWATGKRKTAIAQIILNPKEKRSITINRRELKKYFPSFELQSIVNAPLNIIGVNDKYSFVIKVKGGGFHCQAEAIRLGISRALIKLNPEYRSSLKPAGFLTRDARKKERKKPGLKRARRAPQWAKR